MKNLTLERPSMLAAFCAPTSAFLPRHEFVVASAAGRAQLAQMHQAWTGAKQARVRVTVGGSLGSSGFLGTNGIGAGAYATDGASGVPPRGRPA